MSIFGTYTTGTEKNDSERKWNLMWDMWVEGNARSPYAELMEYDSEVNNGGHFQYFFNTANCGDLQEEVQKLLEILPNPLHDNLKRGYDAFAAQKDIFDDDNEDLFAECDDVFYEHEQLVIDILKTYADSLTL